MDPDRLEKIRESIPKRFFFDDSFEKNGFASCILAEIPISYERVQHGNLLNCSPLLKKDEEFRLFRKFNYLRYRLVKLTNGFEPSEAKPSPKPCKGHNLEKLKESGVAQLESLVLRIFETRNVIMKANTRLIVKQAQRYSEFDSLDYEEMLSNGCMHLMKAIDNFDFRRGIKFSTYCINVLKQNLWRDRGGMLNERTKLDFSESIDAEPSKAGMDMSELNAKYNRQMIEKIFEHIRHNMTNSEDKVEIIRGYFGLDGGEPLLLRHLSEKLGISRERVRQIKKQVILEVGRSGLVYDPIV